MTLWLILQTSLKFEKRTTSSDAARQDTMPSVSQANPAATGCSFHGVRSLLPHGSTETLSVTFSWSDLSVKMSMLHAA
jgi:hypothetical protein